jgi:ElaB/YqjD/DUF883 family membrane-anchored ribosome-binding protein
LTGDFVNFITNGITGQMRWNDLQFKQLTQEETPMKTTDQVYKSANEAYDKVASAAHDASEVLGEKGEQLGKTQRKLMKECCAYISENPVTSVTIAAVGGFLLSRLFSSYD